MKIEKIKKLKNGKYKLEFLDGRTIILYEDVLLKYSILTNKEISEDLFNELNISNEYFDCYNKALKYSVQKMRSKKEIEKYINRFELSENLKKIVLEKLESNKFVNDSNYLKAFISDKINLSNDGPYKIKKELLEQKISEEDINQELNKYDKEIFEEKIKKIISKKVNSNHKYSNYILKQNILNYLINLGYERNMIINELENIKFDNFNIIEKEFKKIKNKLEKKYDGDKLICEVKNRLIKKGYKMDEINELIYNIGE